MNRHIYNTFLTLITILIFLTGCKGKQTITGRQLPPIPTNGIVGNVLSTQPKFSTMNISKADIRLNYGNYQFTFRSSVKMVRDSIIVASIQPAIGIEMFRIVLTRDNFTVIDKMNRRYAENPYEYLRLKYGINVSLNHFQELLSNRLFRTVPDTATISEYCFTPVSTGDSAVIRDTTVLSEQRSLYFTIARDYRITAVAIGHMDDTPDVQVRYAETRNFGNTSFPSLIDVTASIPNKRPLSAEITINKAEFDTEITIVGIDLSKYNKVTLSKLIP